MTFLARASLLLALATALAGPALAAGPGAGAASTSPDSTTLAPRHFWLPPMSEGGFFAQDKLLHATISYSAGVTLRMSGASPAASLLAAGALGIAKELHDSWMRDPGPGQGASRRDLIADAVGVSLAAMAIHFWLR